MKLGSLFDGIGGFPLAASRYGIIPVWASEIEKFPIEVTKKHFPNMKHLGDITKINGAEIEPVDIITFGSPCQDLSIAGKREGLSGERSGLFSHAVRIIREMRAATDGKYPRFTVWENVPGAFSSNKGEDFRAVLKEITETEIPMPRSGKWATAGMVRTERVDVAWRVLDAQYHGVPQRRRRIFLVADFGGQCAGEILFIEEGLSRHLAESGETRQETAGDVGTGVDKSSDIIFDPYNNAVSDNCTSLGSNCGMSTGRSIVMRMREGCAGGGKGPLISEGKSLTLGCSNDQAVFTYKGIIPFDTTQITSPQNGNNPKPNDPCHPLCANAHAPSIAIPKQIDSTPEGISGAVSSKWAKGTGGPAGDECYNLVIDKQFLFENHSQDTRYVGPLDVAPIVSATFGMGGNNQPFVVKAFTQNQRNEIRDLKDKAGALAAEPGVHQQTYLCIEPGALSRGQGERVWDKCPTLRANMGDNQPAVVQTYQKATDPLMANSHPGSYTGQDAYSDMLVTPYAHSSFADYKEGFGQLRASGGDLGGGSETLVKSGYSVRRLTPLECERLQGFPDGWTDIPGQTEASKEELEFWRDVWLTWDKTQAENPEKVKPRTDKAILKWLKNPTSDSAQYKALGNSVAIPCVDFIMRRIKEVIGSTER